MRTLLIVAGLALVMSANTAAAQVAVAYGPGVEPSWSLVQQAYTDNPVLNMPKITGLWTEWFGTSAHGLADNLDPNRKNVGGKDFPSPQGREYYIGIAPGSVVRMTVSLGDVYEIDKVGMLAGQNDGFNLAPKDVKIYVSLNNSTWDLVADLTGANAIPYVANTYYYEVALGSIFQAQFVRFDISSTQCDINVPPYAWGSYNSDCRYWGLMDQLYVYEYDPIPEPATMSLLALGGLALLRRRGR